MGVEDAGDFAEYVHARAPALKRTAFLLTGDPQLAEDLLQTALLKAWRAWSRVSGDSPDAYVRRVMVTTATSWWRRRWWREHPHSPLLDAGPGSGTGAARTASGTAADELGRAETRPALLAALSRLPARQRAVIVLRYYEDLSEADVAALMGTSVGAVKSQASRGLAKLRTDAALAGWAPSPVPSRSLPRDPILDTGGLA